MTKKQKLVSYLIVVMVAVSFVAASATAQSTNVCKAYFNYWFFSGPLPPGADCYQGLSWFFTPCTIPNPTCPPQAAPSEVCPQCGRGGNSVEAGGPISLGTGNTYIKEIDVKLAGLGGGLDLTRTWLSLWPVTQAAMSVGIFGPNWRSTYEERVYLGGDKYIKYARGDGSFWSFGYNGGTYSLAAPANVSATLSWTTTTWTLTFLSGEKRTFDFTIGHLLSITDRNGNVTTLSYDGSNRLSTVADPAGRHLYFNYGTGATSNLVTSVTSDFGVTLGYAYDAQGRLATVTEPDSTTLTFNYNTQSLITSVTDTNGKVLESHTYDSVGRGLSSSQANGIQSVAITYP